MDRRTMRVGGVGHAMLCMALLICGTAFGHETEHELVHLSDLSPEDRFSYVLARDQEYLSYMEALDLSAETRERLWNHLTHKYEEQASLEAWAEKELGRSYSAEVDLLVITYDQDSEYYHKREALKERMDAELRNILSTGQRELARRRKYVQEHERRRRAVRHEIENMELDLTPVQFEVAMDVFDNQPTFLPDEPSTQGSSGYSIAYIAEKERWRFEQEQNYLESKLIPILSEAQIRRFYIWQEAKRLELSRSLDMYEASEEFMARLFPDRKRRVKMLSPEPLEVMPQRHMVYLECRNNELYRIPVDEIRARASEALNVIGAEVSRGSHSLMQALAEADVEVGAYRADLTYALLAQLVLRPKQGLRGHRLAGQDSAGHNEWYEALLDRVQAGNDALVFVVRDDSLEVFEQAKQLAEARGVRYTHELLDPVASVKFSLGASPAIVTDRPLMPPPIEHHNGNGKRAAYIDIHRDHVVLYPGKTSVPADELDGDKVEAFLNRVGTPGEAEYVVLLLRPKSANLALEVKQTLQDRKIEMAQKLYGEDEMVELSGSKLIRRTD